MAPDALIRPPELTTGQEREANRLELFFDLAYVFVVAELALDFGKNLTWNGLGIFAGLFATIWFSWVGFTLYANRFDTDDVLFRIAKLMGTLAIAGCAASATGATAALATPFVISYLLGRAVLLVLYIRAWLHVSQARPTTTVYLISGFSTCLLIGWSLGVEGTPRYVLWALAVGADVVAVVVTSLRTQTAPLHMEHLPERFGLFVILVLGEGVLGAVTAVHDSRWATESLLTAVAGFVVIAALWWSYFDASAEHAADNLRDDPESEGEAVSEEGEAADPGGRHDIYIYGHLPLTAGIACAAVGLKDLALYPGESPGSSSWLVAGGLALFYLGLSSVMLGTGTSSGRQPVWPLVGVVLMSVVVLAPTGAVAAFLACAVTVALTAISTWLHRRGHVRRLA